MNHQQAVPGMDIPHHPAVMSLINPAAVPVTDYLLRSIARVTNMTQKRPDIPLTSSS